MYINNKKGIRTPITLTDKFSCHHMLALHCLTFVVVATHGVGHARNPPLEYGAARGPADRLLAHAVPQASQWVSQLQRAAHGAALWGLGGCNGNTVGRPVGRRLRLESILSWQPLGRRDVDHYAGGGDHWWRLGGAWRGLHFHVTIMLPAIFAGPFLLWKQNLTLHLLHLRLCLLVGTSGPLGTSGRFRFFFGNQV